MAIKQPYMVKTGIDVDALTLRADPGEAFLVKEIGIEDTGPAEFTKVTVDRVTLAYLSTYQHSENQFWFSRDEGLIKNLMRHLFDLAVFPGFPVAEGQEMRIEADGEEGMNFKIVYETHDPADITPEMPCGSKAKEYIFWNYGTNTLEILAEASGMIDKCLTPKEFPDFPFGAVVPAKTKIELLALMLAGSRKSDGTCNRNTFMKLLRGREVLFDEDLRGLYAYHGHSDFPFHVQYTGIPINLFPEPLVFMPGDELNIEITRRPGCDLAAEKGFICFVQRVTKID